MLYLVRHFFGGDGVQMLRNFGNHATGGFSQRSLELARLYGDYRGLLESFLRDSRDSIWKNS